MGSLWQSILLQLVDVLRQKLSRLPPLQFPSLLGSVDAARLCSAEKKIKQEQELIRLKAQSGPSEKKSIDLIRKMIKLL